MGIVLFEAGLASFMCNVDSLYFKILVAASVYLVERWEHHTSALILQHSRSAMLQSSSVDVKRYHKLYEIANLTERLNIASNSDMNQWLGTLWTRDEQQMSAITRSRGSL